jgi:hypothetical protein
MLEWTEGQAQQWRRATESLRRLTLTYEDDIESDPMIGYRKMCDFLNIVPEPMTVRFKKRNPFPLERIILNFEDVEAALRGSRFEWMLEAGG